MADLQTLTKEKVKLDEPGLYDVIFLNDSITTMEFVVRVLKQIFNKNQEQAEKLRNLQMASVSKNADIKRRYTIRYLQNAVICTKAPSNKVGARGARTTRRIRIVIRWPLAGRRVGMSLYSASLDSLTSHLLLRSLWWR